MVMCWTTAVTLVMILGSLGSEVTQGSLGSEDNADSPLFVTPLIEGGRIHEAQQRSRVMADWAHNVESYAGYMTVDQRYHSNLFFWFFPAKEQPTTAPVLLWLNGGPGFSSIIGALLENGPLALGRDLNGEPQVTERETSWTERFNMLYVDSPVGTGYSFTRDRAGQPTNMNDVVTALYSALIQFYRMFPEHQHSDLYTGGQSYAGKYIPALAKYIHDRNHDSASPPPLRLPLKGVYIGAGLCDAEVMFPEFPESLYYAGLISNHTRYEGRAAIRDLINRTLTTGRTTAEDINLYFAIGSNASENGGLDNILGVQFGVRQYELPMQEFLSRTSTRRALHVGHASGRDFHYSSATVFNTVIEFDFFVHTRVENGFLMDNYKVLHYTGTTDMTVSVAMTEAFLNRVDWGGHDGYLRHVNRRWWSPGRTRCLRGWFAHVGNFTRVIVRNAGHHVPYSQPEAALEMMTNFVFDQPFTDDSMHS
ncbi:putative serine carboxypeptidase CPVL [Babylonia areolata]|uniref:putative serine carboxypeptidase CPVL n=1 Tax=Babylonia areolata TaxID=304850 RepID=UPI003FD07DCD